MECEYCKKKVVGACATGKQAQHCPNRIPEEKEVPFNAEKAKEFLKGI